MRSSRLLFCLALTFASVFGQSRYPGMVTTVFWPGKMYLLLNVVCDPARDRLDTVACLPSGGTTIGQEDGAEHWFVDEQNKSWFGYRLHVVPADNSQFRLTIRPLTEAPSPKLASYRALRLPGYSYPFTVREGDVVRLVLLANPASGRRIVDEIQVFASEAAFNAVLAGFGSTENRGAK